MRPLVLLLFMLPAILHAHPQKSDRRQYTDATESNVTSRGSRKYNPRDEQTIEESQGAWLPERTERRQSSKQFPQQSAPRDQSSAAKSRKRTSSRRADIHVTEPDSASSVVAQVAQQLISPRKTNHEGHSAIAEITFPSEIPRQHLDSSITSRYVSADENNSENEYRRTQTSSRRSDRLSEGSSRRSQNRRVSEFSTESPHRPEGHPGESLRKSQSRRYSTLNSEPSHGSENLSKESSRKFQTRTESALTAESPHRSEGSSVESSRNSQTRKESALSAESPHGSEGPSEKSSRISKIRRNSAVSAESPHRSESPSSESPRKSQNSRESSFYTEAQKMSGRRGISTGGRRHQSSLTSGIVPSNVEHRASLLSVRTETPSLTPLTKSLTILQTLDATEISPLVSNTTSVPVQVDPKQAFPVTDASEPVRIKTGKVLELRRKDDSGRSGRKSNSSQTGGSRKRNGDNNSTSDSLSSANTRQHNRRPSNYISKLPDVSSSTLTLSDSPPADISRIGFTRRTITADVIPREGETKYTISASHHNVAEVGAPANEPRGRGQFRNRSGELAGTERSMETRKQKTYHRSSVRSDGSRNKVSAAAVPNVKPQTTARNLGDETVSRSSDITQKPLNNRGGSRRSHSRGQELEISKEEEAHSDGSTDLEESFITHSSQQVMTVSVHPYSKDQISASIDHKSRGKTTAGVHHTVDSKAVFSSPNVTADVKKIKPRTANLLLAPTPPPKSTDNTVETSRVRKTEVIGGNSELQGSKFSKTEAKGINNEGNTVITSTPPFTRYSSRKCATMSDENNFNRLPSTTSRGESCDRTYQETSTVPTTQVQQQVLTSTSAPSAPSSAVSYTSRSELKHRLTSLRENLSPYSIFAATKPQPQSASVPTVKKLPDSNIPTQDRGKGGNAHMAKVLKDPASHSTSSFRRSVEITKGENWIVPAPNSVSVVTSQSFAAHIPRFSSRYRNELLRATGLGSRGSTTPVYVPTVPTVSTTSATEQTMFSDKQPDALNLLDVTELSTPSIWKHNATPQPVHPTSPPSKGSTLMSMFHNSKGEIESKISVSNVKSSVLSVSVQQSNTGSSTANLQHLDNGSKPITQQSNDLSNNYPSYDIWTVQRNLNNSKKISALSTKISPNTDTLSAKDAIKNTETTDSNDFPKNPETAFKLRQNLPTNSPHTTSVKVMSPPNLLPNLKFSISTILNQPASTKINPITTETVASAESITSVLTKENNPNAHRKRNVTALPLLIKNLGNNLLTNFRDIFPSTTESPPYNIIKATTPAPNITDNTSLQFEMRLTPVPRGPVSSNTSRVVRVREIKAGSEPAVPPVSTLTDSYIQRIPPGAKHQSNVQARAATEVPTIVTTTDIPLTNNELTMNNILTLDLPTTTLETQSMQTTTLSTTNIQTTTLPSFDIPTTIELLTIEQSLTIPTTTVQTTTTIPTTTVQTTTTIPTNTDPITTSLPTSTAIHTISLPVTTTTPSTDIQTITVPITTTIPTTTAIPTTAVPTTTTIPTPTTTAPSITLPHVTSPSTITLKDADSNIQPLSVIQTTTAATPRVFTTTLRTPAPYVIFGIYPNGTVFRKIPNSNFKEQVHENEIARHDPFYPDHRYFSTTPPAPAQFVGSNEVAPLAPSFDDGFNTRRNEIQDEDAQVQQLPSLMTASPQQRPQQPSGPTEAPAQTSGFPLGNLISDALGIDPQIGFLPTTRAEFLASIVRNSIIITANTTATTTTTTATTKATTTTKPASQSTVPSTSAAPKTTENPAAGVLDDFSLLNVLLMGRPPDVSPRPGRDQGSSIANRIIQVAVSRGKSSSTKPPAPTPTSTNPKPTTPKITTLNATTAVPQQSTVKQNQEDVAGLLKLLESMEYTTPGNLTPSEQLLADFLAKQATSPPSERNLSNQIRIQDILNPPVKDKRAKGSKPPSATTAAPGRLLGELFNPLLGVTQGNNKIRDPRAGQGLVETAISATKAVSQIMGSVFEGATKSLQSFMKSLAWGSGEASG